jgi:hypothetical protein
LAILHRDIAIPTCPGFHGQCDTKKTNLICVTSPKVAKASGVLYNYEQVLSPFVRYITIGYSVSLKYLVYSVSVLNAENEGKKLSVT